MLGAQPKPFIADRNAPFDVERLKSIFVELMHHPAEDIESETIEIKGWCSDEKELHDKIHDSAACLANTNGGLILVGVADRPADGSKFSACRYPALSPESITTKLHDLTRPPVDCQVQNATEILTSVAGRYLGDVFAIKIPKSRYPGGHRNSKGVHKVRVGKDCKPQYSAEDDRSSVVVPGVTTSDLSMASIEWALKRKAQSSFSPFQALAQCRFFQPCEGSDETFDVTLAAILFFGKREALERVMGHFETLVIADGSGAQPLRKNISDLVKDLCWSDQSVIPSIAGIRPEAARELLVNAYVHRCYRIPGPVIVRISNGTLEIESPGELPAEVSLDNLINCTPVYRNLMLAEGARWFGLCDKQGNGFDVVYKTLLEDGLPFPEFESAHHRFVARVCLTGSDEFKQYVRLRGNRLSTLEEIIVLRALWNRSVVTLTDVTRAVQRSRHDAQRVMAELARKLIVDQVSPETYTLSPVVKNDIQAILHPGQFGLFNR